MCFDNSVDEINEGLRSLGYVTCNFGLVFLLYFDSTNFASGRVAFLLP